MRKVLEASFHQSLFVRNVGDLGRTLTSRTSIQGTKAISVEMETDGNSLYMKLERAGIKAEALVPLANCVVLELAPEEVKAKK